jgi:hypothetical protein
LSSSSGGACILVNKKLPFLLDKVESDAGGCYIIVKCRIFSEVIILYASNHDDLTFVQSLCLKLSSHHRRGL